MLIKHYGILFFWIGLGIAVGGGVPSHGFKKTYLLFVDSKKMKEKGIELSIEHKDARNTFNFYFLGGFVLIIGCVLLLIDLIAGA